MELNPDCCENWSPESCEPGPDCCEACIPGSWESGLAPNDEKPPNCPPSFGLGLLGIIDVPKFDIDHNPRLLVK